MENLIKGEKDLFELEVEGLVGSYLTDPEVETHLVFYIRGRRGQGEVSASTVVPAEEGRTNKFYVAVDTSQLPEGEMMCEISVQYPNPVVAQHLKGMAVASTDCNITVNIESL